MKQVIFKELDLFSFKGIKKYNLKFSFGRNILSGRNGLGKTTLAEAITFTLFGKGLMDEQIQNEPLGKNGKVVEDYVQTFKLKFSIDEKEYIIEKTLIANQVTDIKINEKKYSWKEYQTTIQEILGFERLDFYILANPRYIFSLSSPDARKYILKQISEINEVDLVNKQSNFPNIKIQILENLNKDINLSTQLQYTNENITVNKLKLRDIKVSIKSKEETKKSLTATQTKNIDFDKHKIELEKLEKQLGTINLENENISKNNQEINIKKRELDSLNSRIEDGNNDIEARNKQIEHLNSNIKMTSEKFNNVSASVHDPEKKEKCVICSSEVEISVEEFESNKKTELDKLQKDINSEKERISDVKDIIQNTLNDNKIYANKIEETQKQLHEMNFKELINPTEINNKIKDINGIIGTEKSINIIDEEISKLKKSENDLNKLNDSLDDKQSLLVSCLREKAKHLEESLNSKLKTIKIKLFKENKTNGNLKEIFTVTSDGVPYKNINFASQINGGIELVNFLQELKKINLPLIIDNTESINEVNKANSQSIELKVTNEAQIKHGGADV